MMKLYDNLTSQYCYGWKIDIGNEPPCILEMMNDRQIGYSPSKFKMYLYWTGEMNHGVMTDGYLVLKKRTFIDANTFMPVTDIRAFGYREKEFKDRMTIIEQSVIYTRCLNDIGHLYDTP